MNGYHYAQFDNQIYLTVSCSPGTAVPIEVVYTDPTGATATKTKSPTCAYYTP